MQHMNNTIRSVLTAHGIDPHREFHILLAWNESSNFNNHSYLAEWRGAGGGALLYRSEEAHRAAVGDDASCFDLWPWAVEEVPTDCIYAMMHEAGMVDQYGGEAEDCPPREAAIQMAFSAGWQIDP